MSRPFEWLDFAAGFWFGWLAAGLLWVFGS